MKASLPAHEVCRSPTSWEVLNAWLRRGNWMLVFARLWWVSEGKEAWWVLFWFCLSLKSSLKFFLLYVLTEIIPTLLKFLKLSVC